MGVNIPENKSEGSSFESALGFHEADRAKKPLTESTGEWERVVDKYIVQTGDNIPKKPVVSRPSKIEYYLKMAETVSTRSTCLRIRYGSVIVKNDRIISTGYNGSPKGRPNCCDIGECYRKKHNIPHMTRYETCASVHSEMNAIISGTFHEMNDSTLYLCGIDVDSNKYVEADCCMMCKRAIINAGIKNVIFRTAAGGYREIDVADWNNDSNY